ncbi:FAD/NAD(P)-binding oxidoreductase family protein [Quillaja saponaria]|uniref:FAD/NAD(P)-binding oxidoreductase family protein n=1 Tax=Quillaja saponaria TaxID=32244 RepID=A0AAD7LDE9_QUISA|nr:FAD/NAD(P)-binding oxidoreductase family protein [Quillaja saponaria]
MSLLPSSKLSALHFYSPSAHSRLSFPSPRIPYTRTQTLRTFCAKRTGKRRYPSEKKKLKLKNKEILSNLKTKNKFEGIWRLSKLGVPVGKDPGKDFLHVSDGLLEEIAKVLEFPVASMLPREAFSVVRKSFDSRKMLKEPKFVHTVDMDVKELLNLEPRTYDFISRLEPKVGLVEHVPVGGDSGNLISIIDECKKNSAEMMIAERGHNLSSYSGGSYHSQANRKPKVAVVGSGPSGLFASLVLAELGADVTLIERGQAVERRGRDIGALVVRRILELESNFCFGEGGAGTWSDGKLVTRIGRNSSSVLAVLKTLVHFGAPNSILVDGKPHLGTDRLVPLLRNFRRHLQELGVTIKFGTRVDDLLIEDKNVVGVRVSNSGDKLHVSSQKLECDAVVLAVGHSARDIYQMLLSHDVVLVPKDFAVGLRIEHPQELINSIQYSGLAAEVRSGRGKVPVADYKVVNYVGLEEAYTPSAAANRGCYSFCMCPGGQVVPTSTSPSELCINGMSFSRRASRWANAALVVTVSMKDFEALNFHGLLAGVEFQREFERRAAVMGGGNFVVPVQTVTDFLENKLSETTVPPSSYRLGVKPANLHELFPIHITEALQHSISKFDKETRTSSPIQIPRSAETYESPSLKGLYPVGEGAGYAGGIMSAAVDGMYAGFTVAKNFSLFHGDIESVLGKAQTDTSVKY